MQGSVERRRSIPDEMFLNIEIPNPPEEVKDQIVKQHKLIKEIENSLKENQKIASKDRSIMGTSSKLQLIPFEPTTPCGFSLSIKAYLNLIINYFHLWFNLCLLLYLWFNKSHQITKSPRHLTDGTFTQ